MKCFLILIAAMLTQVSPVHSQVFQADSNEINDVLEEELQDIRAKQIEQLKKEKERLNRRLLREKEKRNRLIQKEKNAKKVIQEEKSKLLIVPDTKKFTIVHGRLTDIQVGRLTLEDSSKWIIQSNNVAKTLLWKINDKIQIRLEKNIDPVNTFSTKFINLNRSEQIFVMLEVLPQTPSPISRFMQLDPKKVVRDLHGIATNFRSGSIIELHNGSKFNISPLDMITSKYWKANQSIKLHRQEHDAHPFILLNQETQEKVTANLIKPPNPPFRLKIESALLKDIEYENEFQESEKVDGVYMGTEKD